MEKTKVCPPLPTGALKGARFEAFAPLAAGAGGGGALASAPLAGSACGPGGSPTARSLAASPSGMAMCTPSNVATTVWRTYVCPSAPMRKQGDASSCLGSPTSVISAAMSPMADGFRMGLQMSAMRAGSAPPRDGVASVSSGSVCTPGGAMPVCTPSDAATTAWRTSTCPDAPARTRQAPMTFSISPSAPGSAGPKQLFSSPAGGGTPAHGFEARHRSWSDAAAAAGHSCFAGGCSPQSGILFMPEPRRAAGGRPAPIRTGFDSGPSSAAGTPMGTPLNTAFIGTPGSRGGYHMAMDPTSPFFGKRGVPADVTPMASTTGAVRMQMIPASTPLYASEASKGADSMDVDVCASTWPVEAQKENRWGQLGA